VSKEKEQPALRITDRDGMAALWTRHLNIWDVPHHQLTPQVLNAIRSAIHRGYHLAVEDMREAIATGFQGKSPVFSDDWDDQRKTHYDV
jgi:hypothetical protein